MEKEEEAARCLRFLVDRIHTTVLASIGSDGYPHTCAVDMMHFDAEGAYFLTARGKDLYRRLSHNPRVSLTGVRGEDTMSSVAVSLVGDVEEVGPSYLEVLLEANPYMYDIYPTNESRSALTVFRIRRAEGNGSICPRGLWKGSTSVSGTSREGMTDTLSQKRVPVAGDVSKSARSPA